MGSVWSGATSRDKSKVQVEFCALCGRLEAAEDLIEATAQGLRGHFVCRHHVGLALNPSFSDIRGEGESSLPEREELLPHSGADWAIEDWS